MAKGKGKTVVSTVATPVSRQNVDPVQTDNAPVENNVHYTKLKITECSTAADPAEGGKPPLTPDEWKQMMYWETEPEYQARMAAKFSGTEPEKYKFGENYHCKNSYDQKVRCWRNPNNRPFDMPWCKSLRFTILHGLWAGPHTIPGETVNGETVRIGKYGNLLSGQHEGTAVILADEELQIDRAREDYTPDNAKYPFWNGYDHPFIETIVITGLSEDERVLRTIDYVKPRTAADMLYTMPLFRDNNPAERKEMTRMLAVAIDTLWDRTKALGYKTHPEIDGFLKRHEKLLEMIEHVFTENSVNGADGGRKISKLGLSPGMCTALAYLMACSGNDDEEYGSSYRNGSPPNEKLLDFSLWDHAKEFWTRMAGARSFLPVRHKLKNVLPVSIPDLDYPNCGLGGKLEEKLAVVSHAWGVWRNHSTDDRENEVPPFTVKQNADGTTSYPDLEEGGSLHLEYTNLSPVKITEKGSKGGEVMPDGKIRLLDDSDLGGIDYYDKKNKEATELDTEPEPPAPSEEEIEAGKEEQLRLRAEEEEKEKAKEAHKRKQEYQRKLLENRATKLRGGTQA